MDTGHARIRTGRCRSDRAPKSFREPDHDRPRLVTRTFVPIEFGPLPRGIRLRSRWRGGIDHGPCLGRTDVHFENGVLLAEGERFRRDAQITAADVDLDLLRQERASMGTFHDNRTNRSKGDSSRNIHFTVVPPSDDIGFDRTVERCPFVPSDESRLQQDCYEAYNIQVAGLVQRLRATGSQRVVIGVSGGLDSTHALIVTAKAMDLLGRPRANILAYTMPGFATGTQSKRQAWALMRALEVSSQELDIRPPQPRC